MLKQLKKPTFSPLRYPGGKSSLFPLMSSIVRSNAIVGGTYVEPYAGGAGLALALLLTEQVEQVIINDLDEAIFAFWSAVTSQNEEFVQLLSSTELSVTEWNRQREIYKAGNAASTLELGFATFYINRTSRSGVLFNSGIIGGRGQNGNYKIDARFNRETLAERCRLIALYAKRIQVLNCDGVQIVEEFAKAPRTLIYADPPYFGKGSDLYMNAFMPEQHQRLAEALNGLASAKWIVTYDDSEEIAAMYSGRRQTKIDVGYSLRTTRRARELLIASDSLVLTNS